MLCFIQWISKRNKVENGGVVMGVYSDWDSLLLKERG